MSDIGVKVLLMIAWPIVIVLVVVAMLVAWPFIPFAEVKRYWK